MGKKKRKKSAEPMVITEMEYKDVTMRSVLVMAALAALTEEMEDILKYEGAQIVLGDKKLVYKCMINEHLAKRTKGYITVLDEVTNNFFGGSEKSFFQAMGISDAFTKGLDNMKTIYYEAVCKAEEEKRQKIHTMNVCYKCGKMHDKHPDIKYDPFVGTCDLCGDEDVQVMNSKYYQFCGYTPDPSALEEYEEKLKTDD